MEEQKARIQAAVYTVTKDILKNYFRVLSCFLDILLAAKGHAMKLNEVNGYIKNYDSAYILSR